MKKIFTSSILGLLLIGSSILEAQSIPWGYAHTGYWVQGTAEAADGSVFTVGYGTEGPAGLESASFVAKLSTTGEELWTNTPDGFLLPYMAGQTVMPQADGGCIVTGTSIDATPAAYRLSNSGSLVWVSSWADSVDFGYLYAGQAAQLADGNMVLGGFCEDFNNRFIEFDVDGNIIKTHAELADSTAWAFSYFDFKETGIVATADGGFAYACGRANNKLLYKYDNDLGVEWLQEYPYDASQTWEYGYSNALETTTDGGYLYCGSGINVGGFYNGTLRKLSSDGTQEWFQIYNHGSYGEEGAWAVQLSADTYIIWTQNDGDMSSAGWVLDSGGNEIDSISIAVNDPWYIPTFQTGLEIFDVCKSQDGGYLLAGRSYTDDFSSRYTVIKSNNDGTFPPCLFDCVWPGDANNDGYALIDDLFEIGIDYGATGLAREDNGIDWSPKLSQAWNEPDSLYWYVINDIKYADSNGDSTVNDDDTTAIGLNLGLDHPINSMRQTGEGAPLYFSPEYESLSIGLNEIPIMLGDDVNQVGDIYGIHFTINAEGEDILGSSLKVTLNDSWLGTSGNSLSISRTDGGSKLVVTGIVRKDRINTSGFGQIGTLSIVVIDNISGKTTGSSEASLSFSDVEAIKLNRELVAVTPQSITFPVIAGITNSDNEQYVSVYPNPANANVVSLHTSASVDYAELFDLTGKSIKVFSTDEVKSGTLSISDIVNGEYFLRLTLGETMVNKKLVIIK